MFLLDYTKLLISLIKIKSKEIDEHDMVQKYKNKITFGCSFSPEEIDYKTNGKVSSLEALRIIVEEFGIREIRLGIRWSEISQTTKPPNQQYRKIELGIYKDLLKYCFQNKVNVCLNVGPIKTFRWPEEHIPQDLKSKFLKSKQENLKEETTANTKIEKEALNYLESLLLTLNKTFSKEELKYLKTIQPENEAFNSFGQFGWIMNQRYLLEIFDLLYKYFPDKDYMMSSSACLNTKDIRDTFQNIRSKYNDYRGDLIFGINYYYKTPFNTEYYPIFKYFDNILIPSLRSYNCYKLKRLAKKEGFKIEVAEAQTEGWGSKIKSPGKNYKEFKQMTLRLIKDVLNIEAQDKSIIRIWGIENLAIDYLHEDLSVEQEKILEFIRKF